MIFFSLWQPTSISSIFVITFVAIGIIITVNQSDIMAPSIDIVYII